jgi:hypothetical protein
VPDTLLVNHVATITSNTTSVNVAVNNNNATVVLMHYDSLFSVRPVVSGSTTHNFASLQAGDSIMVSVTAPNTRPYFGKIMVITPADVANAASGSASPALYPNPAKNMVYVKGLQGNTNYNVTDVTGKRVLSGVVANNGSIETGKLAPGNYLVELMNGDKASSLPLQVQR